MEVPGDPSRSGSDPAPDARAGSGPEGPEREEAPPRTPEKSRLWVEDGGGRHPFMRGIMIHSLMARGVSFEEADRTANLVRDRLRSQGVVTKQALHAEARKILGGGPFEGDRLLPRQVDIVVEGKGRGQPFSKGILSQSLLAAAIDPHDAFDVAREIEHRLIRRGVDRIQRHEIRVHAFEELSRTMGPQAAERYLVWRKYEDPDRPVILLLGGAPGVGKTSLALEVAHRLGIGRVLSSDSVRQIMRLMLSPELAPAIHGSSYDAWQHFPPDALGDDPVIEGFRLQAATVSVGIRASIDRAISETASTVIDGVSVVPGVIDVDAYADQAEVIFLVVAALDREAYASRFEARARGQSQRAAHRYVENLDAILRIQDHVLEAAERHGVPIVDNDSFDRAVMLIIRHVTETLRTRGEFDRDLLLQPVDPRG
jgi:2-phosphoglycerate kinase